MMKKEARLQAEEMFLNSRGQITNRKIASAVSVNPLTVGRWKRQHHWESRIIDPKQGSAREGKPDSIRKKAARDQALGLYMQAGGNVTNKELAKRVGVSPATISKWKEADGWINQLQFQPMQQEQSAVVHKEHLVNVRELAAPWHITEMNRRIDILLQRDHLTAGELLDLAGAKNALLEGLETFVVLLGPDGLTRDDD